MKIVTDIEFKDSFQDIDPRWDIGNRGIDVLGVDVENVLTDFGNPEVLPGVAEHMEDLLVAGGGIKVVLITNKRDTEFLDNVVSQLPGNLTYVNPNEEQGLKKKPSPSMFTHVVESLDVDPQRASHVDDQSKAWIGANKAGYKKVFWTKPVGRHQHMGVRALRPIEFGIVRPGLRSAGWVMNKLLDQALADK